MYMQRFCVPHRSTKRHRAQRASILANCMEQPKGNTSVFSEPLTLKFSKKNIFIVLMSMCDYSVKTKFLSLRFQYPCGRGLTITEILTEIKKITVTVIVTEKTDLVN